MKNKALSLSELITNIADELRIAKNKNANEKAVMAFKECELELKVNIKVEGTAGIKFWIIEFGGGAARERGHTIKMKFNALENNPIEVD